MVAYLPRVFAAVVIVVVGAAIGSAVREIVLGALGGLSYGRALAIGAMTAIVTLAVLAALDQLLIAPAIVHGLYYALLATVAGTAIVAIGGGGIAPMRARWERALQRWDEERPRLREELANNRENRPVEVPAIRTEVRKPAVAISAGNGHDGDVRRRRRPHR